MNPRTQSFLRSRFREYYLEASLDMPPGFQSREWGFRLFGEGGMRRHKAFSSRGEMVDYVRSVVPAHVYHSAAYYDSPGAPTMKEKIWKGADLIFDLDADHLKNAPSSFGDMLDLVKAETIKLLEFLVDDFGLGPYVQVVFSGGRGYHIHVREQRVIALQSDARREIVDYLTGRGLDLDRFFPRLMVTGDAGIEKAQSIRGPSQDAPGWGGRINRAVRSLVSYIGGLDEDQAMRILAGLRDVGPKRAKTFYLKCKEESTAGKIRSGSLDFFKGSSGLWSLLLPYLEEEGIQVAPFMDGMRGETDEPVTADVRRLIRFPGSLHGGSGLRVTPLSIDSLQDFNPLRDAVVFSDEPVAVEVTKPVQAQLKGQSFDLQPGRFRLPSYAVVFFAARGAAEILGKD